MTELEMSLTLGLLAEPEKNRVKVDPLLQAEIMYLKSIFAIAQNQKNEVGRANPDIWANLIPWHSAN
jgi:hypothetical protein